MTNSNLNFLEFLTIALTFAHQLWEGVVAKQASNSKELYCFLLVSYIILQGIPKDILYTTLSLSHSYRAIKDPKFYVLKKPIFWHSTTDLAPLLVFYSGFLNSKSFLMKVQLCKHA